MNTPSQITHLRLIKLLTGEDSVAARQLYAEQFNFLPQAKVWLRTNNRPEIRGTDNAIWRRVVALPFGQIVPTEKRDRFLREKLNAELDSLRQQNLPASESLNEKESQCLEVSALRARELGLPR